MGPGSHKILYNQVDANIILNWPRKAEGTCLLNRVEATPILASIDGEFRQGKMRRHDDIIDLCDLTLG